ncbi:hypothetical protein TeGR_g9644, partial [Tetraparma gracilis]
MVLLNKALNGPAVSLPFLLVLAQSLTAVLLCHVFAARTPYIARADLALAPGTALAWLPVNLFFCGMLMTSMKALEHNSVPMVTVFKNVSNVSTAAGDVLLFGRPLTPLHFLAFLVMLAGAAMSSYTSLEFRPLGVFWMLANCLLTSGYILYMKHATQTIKLSKFGM